MRRALVSAFLLCACGGGEASPAPEPDAQLTDSIALDTGSDTESDTGSEDADAALDATDADAPASCVPDSFRPPRTREAKCTKTQLGELFDACLSSTATTASCNAFRTAHFTCFSCFLTDSNAPLQGAATQWNQTAVRYLDVNSGGCLSQLAGDKSATSCGAKWDAWTRCAIASCCKSTPFSAFTSCVASAKTSACAAEKAAFDACLPSVSNGKSCFPAGHSTAKELYTYVGEMFCTAP